VPEPAPGGRPAGRRRRWSRPDGKVDLLATHPALQHLRRRHLRDLCRAVDLVEIPCGEVLLVPPARGAEAFLLVSGEVHVDGNPTDVEGLVLGLDAPETLRLTAEVRTSATCFAWLVDPRYRDWVAAHLDPPGTRS
jgi:hypothetical protein